MRARTLLLIPAFGTLALAAPSPGSGLLALRASTAIRLDGRLDESVWREAPAASGFIQEWPWRGQPARQRTEVRVLYDARFLYIGARMHHDRALDGGQATVVRRLHRRDQDSQSDWFSVALDSDHDRRTAQVFEVNAAGVQRDQTIYNDSTFDASWDGVWESATTADADGWTVELKIPLSLLRFKGGMEAQTWGINFSRTDQGNLRESSRWMVVPRGESGFVSRFPDLTGLENLDPQPRREFIPYLGLARKFETARGFDDRRWEARAGLDARLSLNTHAQVDL
ncbi:MAG TPA: carbohydrate binding family 9 domain-containing protein, partial [Geothrix sp.]|nr:carbohydrate binding family 9 domain-containing protein [Geothrix sp.]